VAFPLISSGIYRWPKPDAVARALTAVEEFSPTTVEVVRLVLFDEETPAHRRDRPGTPPLTRQPLTRRR
jgi:O-acetyl-ADP-ribose deacetylase (regulator of RNase III)